MTEIYILRHAQSQANADQIVSGGEDTSPLSDLGRRQAKLAGENAKAFKFDLILSSPMLRAKQTAELIAEATHYPSTAVGVLSELRERNMGELGGLHYSDSPLGSGDTAEVEGVVPGLEPLDNFHERAEQILVHLKKLPAQKILLVCHNGIGRMLQTAAAGKKPIDFYKQPRLSNAIIYRL